MYFYDIQGFYKKEKCIEGLFNMFTQSTTSPPAEEQPAPQTGLFGVNTSTPPAEEQPAQQTDLFGINTSVQNTPPAQQSSIPFVNTSTQNTPPVQQSVSLTAQAESTSNTGTLHYVDSCTQCDPNVNFCLQANNNKLPEDTKSSYTMGSNLSDWGCSNVNENTKAVFFENNPEVYILEQQTSTTSSTTSQEQTISSQSQIPLINLNPPIQQASNQNLNNSLLNGYVTNLVSSKFNELNKSNENTNRIINIKIFTLKDPEVFIINDETKANSYNEESSKIFRVFYKPKLEKSQILIEISSYYDISGTHKDKFECEINVSEDKNHYTDSKGGKRIAIRKIRFEKQIGGGARTGSFFPSGIFKNNNTKPKYFHFNVKREGSDDRFKLARGKNSNFLEVEGLIKIIEIKTN
jgi:hypothetical protein